MLFRSLARFSFLKLNFKFNSLLTHQLSFSFSKKSSLLDAQLQLLANTVNTSNSSEDLSEIVNNYIQLQQKSFTQYAKQNKNDPQLMLMLLSTFENQQQIVQYLPTLYQYIDYFQKSQLLLLLQKVLAFKPKQKPKVPFPKPLQDIQSILVIMSQIYKADMLIQWIKLVPLYTKKQYYVLYMGYFSILQKMSPEVKSRNQALLIKCHVAISQVVKDQSEPLQVRVGILISAFQLNYGQAVPLFLLTNIDFQSLQAFKNCFLFVNISKYLNSRKQIDDGLDSKSVQSMDRMIKKSINQMVSAINESDFMQFMKVDLMMEMWSVLGDLKQTKGIYQPLINKLLALFTNKKFTKAANQLSTKQLLMIFQCLQKHKINNEKAVKLILVLFSTHLRNMDKGEFIRLLKCLVTYVRQCQDYLINVRQVLQQRKLQFNKYEAVKINQILKRVEVLFPKKFQAS